MLAPAIIPVDTRWRLPVWAPLAPAFALLLAFQLISPLGYVGGGADDWRYLEAARCLAREGYCTPETHWAARWPLVAPLALTLRLFGDGVVQASLAPALYGLTALAAYQAIVARIWDVRVAAVAGVALVCTAAFSRPLFQPAVDVPEFALLALAVWLAERNRRTGGAGSALLAGACFGAALFARMAGVVFIPFLLLLVVARPDWRRTALLGFAGAGAILTADALIHLAIEGDALLSWRLALSHTSLPSSELGSSVDTSRSPILNPDYIGGWRPASGIAAHWLLQGPVNLFMNPKIG
ncbi:MAG TPA: glycosyltransferase family 39 protein, partial [Sphingomonas sp.]